MGVCRTTEIETPLCRYSKRPTVMPSTTAAVNRSVPDQRTTSPSSEPATSQTSTYHTTGDAAWRESSSSGSASPMRGPGTDGRTRYSQPVADAATSTANGSAVALRSTEASREGEVGAGCVATPDRPVVSAADDVEAVRDAE